MLTQADKKIWEHFQAELARATPGLEAEDMVPVVIVFSRVRWRSDDAAVVSLVPGDVTLLAQPDVQGYTLAALLEAAAAVARKGRPR